MISCSNFATRKNDQSTEQMPALRRQQRCQTQRFKTESRSSRCQRRARPASMSISGGSTTAHRAQTRKTDNDRHHAASRTPKWCTRIKRETAHGKSISARAVCSGRNPAHAPAGTKQRHTRSPIISQWQTPRGPERGPCHVVRPGTIHSWN